MSIIPMDPAHLFSNGRATYSTPPNEEGQELDNRSPPDEPTRAETLMSEINQGVYPCGICTDSIAFGSAYPYGLWHCLHCHNVYHFRCVKDYCDYRGPRRGWACPSCKATQPFISHATCWCGKQCHAEHIADYSTNSCADVCGRLGTCPHGEPKYCTLNCHAGPCSFICSESCQGRAVLDVVVPREPFTFSLPACFERLCNELGPLRAYVCLWTILGVLYALLGVLLCFHIRWNTMPWRYPPLDTNLEKGIIALAGIFVWLVLELFLVVELMSRTVKYLAARLELSAYGRLWHRNRRIEFWGVGVLLVVFAGIWALPAVGFYVGPGIAWHNQMKNSCSRRFQAISTTHSHPPRNFYLADHVVPSTADNTAPFQYFHRLSGATGATGMAVDVDLQNQQWRLLRLNSTDTANSWLAYDSKASPPSTFRGQIPFPTFTSFPTPHETLVHSGSFGPAGANMRISGLGPGHEVEIFNMYAFIMQYKQEPFLRVFSGSEADADAHSSADRARGQGHERNPTWTHRPHALEHMRTASFGYGRGELTMCARGFEQPWHYVPFAIVAAYRDRLREVRVRKVY
ncbi:hypothetical protein B2J93_577 [Marssonina coronariae]|uniref:RING-type domain-containing protein n=1 Tax=Diplocarpon coronariae TaxID=2795749 RepID=A0A218ZAF8_9HELO|nr:hypothetical protein B2J93_577 [Marssonina coronariae]